MALLRILQGTRSRLHVLTFLSRGHFPSQRFPPVPPAKEHIYRNPRTEVQRLLDKYHKEQYKVYNFTNEAGRAYPEQYFQGRVER